MKKYFMACAAVCVAMAMVSCGASKESAYRKAYEKAKAQETAQQQSQNPEYAQQPTQQVVQQPTQQVMQQPTQQVMQQPTEPTQQAVVTPLQQSSAQQTVTARESAGVRSEQLTVVSGNGLKAYSVVVGSFGVRANAEGLQSTLNKAGYSAQVAYNEQQKMYRVIAATFDTRNEAANSRDNFRSTYPSAWLLYQK